MLPLVGLLALPYVRIGGLFPRFKTSAAAFGLDTSGVRRLTAFVQAVNEINNKTDGIADDLLPNTRLLFATRDSKRDTGSAFLGARQLVLEAFDGLGVSAVVGAASSGPSQLAALALGPTRTPQISYSSTSATLSDGATYKYFLRTPPSDAFQARGLAELAKQLFGFTRLAAVSSSDAYGADGIAAFLEAARAASLTVVAQLQFGHNAADFSEQLDVLGASHARVIVLFCGTSDAARFIEAAYDAGIGGEGYLWLGSDAVTNSAVMESVTNRTRRDAIFNGYFGLVPSTGAGKDAYAAYVARMRALPSTEGNGTHCDAATDDDGNLLWAADHDGDAATPLACAGSANQVEDSYAPYTYDAVFAIAAALHKLIEVRNASAIDGDALMSALTGDRATGGSFDGVSFGGVTGRVEFNDAGFGGYSHGDRTAGISYEVRNYAGARGLVTVGTWTPCSDGCAFDARWAPAAGEALTYSTVDNSRPFDGVEVGALLQLTGARADLGHEPAIAACAALLAARHASERDGSVVPELAALRHGFFLRLRLADISTDAPTAIQAYRQAEAADVDGVIDGASSEQNVHLAQLGALDALPQLSFYSSSPQLSARSFSHFGRAPPPRAPNPPSPSPSPFPSPQPCHHPALSKCGAPWRPCGPRVCARAQARSSRTRSRRPCWRASSLASAGGTWACSTCATRGRRPSPTSSPSRRASTTPRCA